VSRHADYGREKRKETAEIGGIPAVVYPERRASCEKNLPLFLATYFPQTTGLKPFSPDQILAVERLQIAILEGGSRVINAFPRGFGKTTISENSALWAVLYGHRRFVPIIGSDATAATGSIDSIKTELQSNELLADDFPEVCYPIAALENKAQRCRSQLCNGELTYITWASDKVVLPTVRMESGEYSRASGALLLSRGLTGGFRGISHKRANDAVKQRPDFVILDDIQTDESAESPAQCETRLSLIKRGVLRLGGHASQISCVMNCTCIAEGDIVDQLLDHKKNPSWEGLRIPMLKSRADGERELWLGQYADVRRTYNPEDPRDRKRAIADANQFYRDNRAAMDQGALATWEHCYSDDEVSAIQHAYNILIDDGEHVFASECQNQPIRAGQVIGKSEFLSSKEMQRTRIMIDQMLPREIDYLAFHIDVQDRCAYYCVLGASDTYRMVPATYGQWPEQPRGLVPYAQVTVETFQSMYPEASAEQAKQRALTELIDLLGESLYMREDGVALQARGGLIDAGDDKQIVYRAIRASRHASTVFPLFGVGIGSSKRPMMQEDLRDGEKKSQDNSVPWKIKPDKSVVGQRYVLNCTNTVKTFLHRRIAAPTGGDGSFELLNGDHRAYCDHLCESEYAVKTSGPWGDVYEWKQRPGRPDNHLLDVTCGAIVALSINNKALAFSPVRPNPLARPMRKKVSSLL
jgi:hypothetical protein